MGYFQKKISLISEEDHLKNESVSLQTECDNLKAIFQQHVGQKELELTMVLEKMKVNRRACNGNVFIGNHCKRILKNFTSLTSPWSADSPELGSKIQSDLCYLSGHTKVNFGK